MRGRGSTFAASRHVFCFETIITGFRWDILVNTVRYFIIGSFWPWRFCLGGSSYIRSVFNGVRIPLMEPHSLTYPSITRVISVRADHAWSLQIKAETEGKLKGWIACRIMCNIVDLSELTSRTTLNYTVIDSVIDSVILMYRLASCHGSTQSQVNMYDCPIALPIFMAIVSVAGSAWQVPSVSSSASRPGSCFSSHCHFHRCHSSSPRLFMPIC